MPAPHLQNDWTEDAFYAARDAAPPGERWELVDGEVLVTPSPNWVHQELVLRLAEHLRAHVRAHPVGKAFVAQLDVKLEPGLVLQPDVLVVPAGELRKSSDIVRHLLIAAEVLSPGSARFDRVTKRPAYQRNGVAEYWVVDPWSRTVERWRPGDERPEVVSEALVWQPSVGVEPFTLDLAGLFADALPEEFE